MRDPAVRAEILNDKPAVRDEMTLEMVNGFHNHFSLGDPPDYEPALEKSILARAKRLGKTPQEVAYDTLLERDGREIIYMPLATSKSLSFDGIRPNLLNPATVLSLSDGGAHCGVIATLGCQPSAHLLGARPPAGGPHSRWKSRSSVKPKIPRDSTGCLIVARCAGYESGRQCH
jgi:N-acyl-D-aspartate/D-glutamate deacylase